MKSIFLKAGGVLAVLLFSAVAAPDDPTGKAVVEGSTGEITWGQHWAGPEIKRAKSLEGKVVLLKIWGG